MARLQDTSPGYCILSRTEDKLGYVCIHAQGVLNKPCRTMLKVNHVGELRLCRTSSGVEQALVLVLVRTGLEILAFIGQVWLPAELPSVGSCSIAQGAQSVFG